MNAEPWFMIHFSATKNSLKNSYRCPVKLVLCQVLFLMREQESYTNSNKSLLVLKKPRIESWIAVGQNQQCVNRNLWDSFEISAYLLCKINRTQKQFFPWQQNLHNVDWRQWIAETPLPCQRESHMAAGIPHSSPLSTWDSHESLGNQVVFVCSMCCCTMAAWRRYWCLVNGGLRVGRVVGWVGGWHGSGMVVVGNS